MLARRLVRSPSSVALASRGASVARRAAPLTLTRGASRAAPSAFTGQSASNWPPPDAAAGATPVASAAAASTELTSTDPLDVYWSMVARGDVKEDEEQIRVMVKLRGLTRRLESYTPPAHLLSILSSSSFPRRSGKDTPEDAPAGRGEAEVKALVAYLSQAQTLKDLDTPKGIILTGPPGRGKTMCLDAWYESLPVRGKFRRHYHHLLLTVYRLIWLEAERRRIARGGPYGPPTAASFDVSSSGPQRNVLPARGTGVSWIRTDETDDSNADVLRSGSGKSWKRVLRGMPFFRPDSLSGRGGASGSDLPYEGTRDAQANAPDAALPSPPPGATNIEGQGTERSLALHVAATLFLNHGHVLLFDEIQLIDVSSAAMLRQILTAYWFLGGVLVGSSNRLPEDLYANHVQRRALVEFLGALRERCEVIQMGGERDWRREDESEAAQLTEEKRRSSFFLAGVDDAAFEEAVEIAVGGRKGSPSSVPVYGRSVHVPTSYAATATLAPICRFTFAELCDTPLGPGDYLTLASRYRTLIIDGIPTLPLASKNQARRLITLLDAVYEAGCQIIVRAAAPIDGLFFPAERREAEAEEQRLLSGTGEARDVVDTATLIQSETMSEAQQDTDEGFRPNVGKYDPNLLADHNERAKEAADEESRQKKRRPEPGTASEAQEKELREGGAKGFMSLAIFSGEDERFSYQRAVSRLHEMSRPTWSTRTWRPFIDAEMDLWGGTGARSSDAAAAAASVPAAHRESSSQGYEGDFADEASYAGSTFPGGAPDPSVPRSTSGPVVQDTLQTPRSQRTDGAPVLSEVHAWGMADWGPGAGAWGRGVRGENGEEELSPTRERRRKWKEEKARREAAAVAAEKEQK